MTPDERAKWLDSLQTFDKVWLAADATGPGRVVEVVVRGDGAILPIDSTSGMDLREADIHPLPDVPYGRCSTCREPLSALQGRTKRPRCLPCDAAARTMVCPAGCASWKEHHAKVRAIHKLRADEIRGDATEH